MNLIIIDNHGLFLHSLKEVLEGEGRISKVYTFYPKEMDQVKRIIRNQTIELVILDINLDGMDGFEYGEKLRLEFPEIRIAFLTGHSNQIYLKEKASMFKAAGFFTKETLPSDLIKQIDQAIRGEQPGILSYKNIESLSKEEQKVLYWVSRGLSNGNIGDEMHYSKRNIERLKASIFNKLGVSNEKEAIRKCFELGYDLID